MKVNEDKIKEKEVKNSNLILENRNKIIVTGTKEILGFNEENIFLNTVLGKLEISGKNLKVCKLDLQNGEVNITGIINSFVYLDYSKNNKSKHALFKKILGKKL